MAKVKKTFFCTNCGAESPKWMGRCPSCGEWNTYTEEIVPVKENKRASSFSSFSAAPSDNRPVVLSEIEQSGLVRIDMGYA